MISSQGAPVAHSDVHEHEHDDDNDTASQRSIPLSSPSNSPRESTTFQSPSHASNRGSTPYTLQTDLSSERDDYSLYAQSVDHNAPGSPDTSVAPSVSDGGEPKSATLPTYPPSPPNRGDTESIASFASGSSKKARPESMLMNLPEGSLILGVGLVDFNHLVGPRIEYSKGEIFQDEEVIKILPFLALPDGAHLSAEDYSYFHLVPSGRKPTTIFGISCNQQIAASDLLVKDSDVTRSTVQKAVVILASKPVFGPIRDKLGVVTSALFAQRDFSEVGILDDFYASLEAPLRSQLTESGLYMGTNLRELVRTFRQKTLILVKALMLQKRIMFYGHPVERLCTYQYSLVSLLPGLLQTLDDCGSPPLAERARALTRPTSLRTSDHKSMMAFMGLPLDVFGQDAFFQPYLPLQQLDVLKETGSWLCGTTNSIVTGQKEIDLLVNTESGAFEFRDPQLERIAGLTAADRKWMDAIVKDVNDSWNEGETTRSGGMRFRGSDDYLRNKFEEYIQAALASVKYRDFTAKGESNGVIITGGTGGDPKATEDFNLPWIAEFKRTRAYDVWDRVTDPLIFDIIEPRHPCNEKPTVVSDLGLRLQEGIQDLKLDQQLAPAREAVTRTFAAGSTNFFKAVEGVRGRWQRGSNTSSTENSRSSTPVEISKTDVLDDVAEALATAKPTEASKRASSQSNASMSNSTSTSPGGTVRPAISSWGSFFSARAPRFSLGKSNISPTQSPPTETKAPNRSGSTSPQTDAPPTSGPATTRNGAPVSAAHPPARVSLDREAQDEVVFGMAR